MVMYPVGSSVRINEKALETLGARFQDVSGQRLLNQDLKVVKNDEEVRGSERLSLQLPESSFLYGGSPTITVHSQNVIACE